MSMRLFLLLATLAGLAWVGFAFGLPAVLLFLAFLSVPALMIGGLSVLSLATR